MPHQPAVPVQGSFRRPETAAFVGQPGAGFPAIVAGTPPGSADWLANMPAAPAPKGGSCRFGRSGQQGQPPQHRGGVNVGQLSKGHPPGAGQAPAPQGVAAGLVQPQGQGFAGQPGQPPSGVAGTPRAALHRRAVVRLRRWPQHRPLQRSSVSRPAGLGSTARSAPAPTPAGPAIRVVRRRRRLAGSVVSPKVAGGVGKPSGTQQGTIAAARRTGETSGVSPVSMFRKPSPEGFGERGRL